MGIYWKNGSAVGCRRYEPSHKNNVEAKQGELCALEGFVAANSVSAAALKNTAPMGARANVVVVHRNDEACPGKGFYTYDAFVAAAKSFGAFATTGDTDTRKREIAAFLAQTSHETTGCLVRGWASAPDGPYAWGYCFIQEQGSPGDYCVASADWPCAAGVAIQSDLINNPDAVATDATISFKTALWFWMTPQSPKPSCHNVITGGWTPSDADRAAGRVPGYGVVTNIINGGIECGKGTNAQIEDRIGFYKRYCDILGVSYGDNLDCYNQSPFG
ncbi:hypothetical protein HHK36_010420 [Tetracentron sinense]|uniref:Glycoside hydrolase family 19 catalytic domain-containing protein n=1 Tax=Tetracentron sinense TaxID=13715 RepID=A0A835DIH9_TETSI|nr:hypothetical protein HHK36_010420 [Tetracentron sinense]